MSERPDGRRAYIHTYLSYSNVVITDISLVSVCVSSVIIACFCFFHHCLVLCNFPDALLDFGEAIAMSWHSTPFLGILNSGHTVVGGTVDTVGQSTSLQSKVTPSTFKTLF